jgi:hypothetical protein
MQTGTSQKQLQAAPATAAPATPQTADEYLALQLRRGELSRQLSTQESRVRRLTDQITSASDDAKPVLLERLKQLNTRAMQIEQDLMATESQLATVSPAIAQTIAPPPVRQDLLNSEQVTAIAIVGILCVLMPIAIAFGRLLWRRAVARPPAIADAEGAQRLKRMEHAVDAMAIEVERISEGQRFLTQVFARAQKVDG